MSGESQNIKPRTKATPEQWLERLTTVLKAMDAMDIDERAASLKYIKSKFAREWPSDSY